MFRRLASLRFRSRASLILCTLGLQTLIVGLGMLLALHFGRSDVGGRLDQAIADDGSRTVASLCNIMSEELGEGGPLATNWAEQIADSVRATIPPVGATIVAYPVELLDTGMALSLEQLHPSVGELPLVAGPFVFPNHANEGADWKRLLHSFVASKTRRPSMYGGETLLEIKDGSRTVINARLQHIETVRSEDGASGWHRAVVVLSYQPLDAGAGHPAQAIARRTTVFFGAMGVLLIGVSLLGTMVFARRYDSKVAQLNAKLEERAEHSDRRAVLIRNGMIFGLAKLTDYRDTDTGQHLERICTYAKILASELAPRFAEITPAWIERLEIGASMHDIGKVGIPDYILLKPGPLTPSERRIMENHPIIGADTLIAIRRRCGDDELLNIAIQVTLAHHERFDGKGYPFALVGEQIPIAARIVSLVDMYDALTSERVYKAAMGHDEARRLIREESGKRFDPVVVEAFLRVHRQIDAARLELAQEAEAGGGVSLADVAPVQPQQRAA